MSAEEEFVQEGYGDFRIFLREVWRYLNLPRPTPVQNDIALALMSPVERLIIEAFRGVGKSFITVAFALWFLRMNPQRKIMVTSASQKDADSFSIFAKMLINEMEILQYLRPRRGQRDSNQVWDVGPTLPDRSPSVKSVGLTGQLTGSRADLIIPDDVEITKNAFSQVLRERNAELVKEFDAVLKPGGLVRYLGTPQTEQSIYNKLIGRGYDLKVWPIELPENPDEYQGRLGPLIYKMLERGDPAHTPVEPTRFDFGEIEARRLSYGRSGFALQFQLNTKLSDLDRHPLKMKKSLPTCSRLGKLLPLSSRKHQRRFRRCSTPALSALGRAFLTILSPMMIWQKSWIQAMSGSSRVRVSHRGISPGRAK
jgi:hypothetical protein